MKLLEILKRLGIVVCIPFVIVCGSIILMTGLFCSILLVFLTPICWILTGTTKTWNWSEKIMDTIDL